MRANDLEKLIEEADECYRDGAYDRELPLRLRIAMAAPQNPYHKHNLALALKNNDRLDEALALLSQLAKEHPELSRVHNNLAVTLVGMGADYSQLTPVFMTALVTSDNVDDFTRHFINICGTIAHGLDYGSEEAFQLLQERFPPILRQISPAQFVESNIEVMGRIHAGYRKIAVYRQNFAERQWTSAQGALSEAKGILSQVPGPFASGIDNYISPTFELTRAIIGTIEGIAVGEPLSPKDVLAIYRNALDSERSIAEKHGRYSYQARLLQLLEHFLNGMIQALQFLDGPSVTYVSNRQLRADVAFLTATSFIHIGNDLNSLLGFIDKQCLNLAQTVQVTATKEAMAPSKEEAWLRIRLFCRGLALDFRGVDAGLARDLLGVKYDPLEQARYEMKNFKAYIERQSYRDIFVGNKPQENIARGYLQSYLTSRSYREVPVRGGYTDILVFTRDGRFLYETKIWRGDEYYQQGLRELEEYILGEGNDGGLVGIFYVIFDATKSHQAVARLKAPFAKIPTLGRTVDVVVINLRPPKPSKKK